MSQTKTHPGGCHCGAVRFEAELDLGSKAGRCNCTFCVKRGGTIMVVKPSAFRIVRGRDDVAEYERQHGNRFYFCRRCGIHVSGSGDLPALGGAFVTVNVACVDDIDPATLAIQYWDGRHDNWQAGPRDTPWPVRAGDQERGQRNG